MFLFIAIIFACACDLHAKYVKIEAEAGIGIADCNGGVIDAKKEIAILTLPPEISLACREMDHLKDMIVRIMEIEGLNAACMLVPRRQGLRTARDMANAILPKPRVCLIHVTDYDGHMLKPEIIASRIHG